MNNKIKHSGIVESTGNDCVMVRIMQASACGACKVAGHCNAAETKEKLIEVNTPEANTYKVGDRVVVVADTAVGFRASWYGYLLPLVLMVVTLVVVLQLTHQEGTAALSSLGVLVPYYLCLYLVRGKLKGKLCFEIERI